MTGGRKQMNLRRLPRSERARIMAARLSEAIRRAVPPGLGRWPGAWEIVADPSEAFIDALDAWERAGDGAPNERELAAAIEDAARATLRAWKEAARRWEEAGRPRDQASEYAGVAHAA
jgi:hypothetical protein